MSYLPTRRPRRSRAPRASSRRRGGRPGRTPLWIRSQHGHGTLAGTTVSTARFDLIPNASLDKGARIGSTIQRAHVTMAYEIPGNGIDGVGLFVVAMAVVPEGVVTTGQLSPFENRNDWDWAAWKAVGPFGVAGSAFVTTVPPTAALVGHVDFDFKSARRLTEPTDTYAMFVQWVPGTSSGTWVNAIRVYSSLLLKLA